MNLVCAGPIKTMAAKSIPGFTDLENGWSGRAPLGWDTSDPTPVARAAVALLSDLFPATSGSMVMVDGGFHAARLRHRGDRPAGARAERAGDRSRYSVSRDLRARPVERARAGRRRLRYRMHGAGRRLAQRRDRRGDRRPAALPDGDGQRPQHVVDRGHLVAGDGRGVLTVGDGQQRVQRDRGGQQRRRRRRRAGRAADGLLQHHPPHLLPGAVGAAGDVQRGQRPGRPAHRGVQHLVRLGQSERRMPGVAAVRPPLAVARAPGRDRCAGNTTSAPASSAGDGQLAADAAARACHPGRAAATRPDHPRAAAAAAPPSRRSASPDREVRSRRRSRRSRRGPRRGARSRRWRTARRRRSRRPATRQPTGPAWWRRAGCRLKT